MSLELSHLTIVFISLCELESTEYKSHLYDIAVDKHSLYPHFLICCKPLKENSTEPAVYEEVYADAGGPTWLVCVCKLLHASKGFAKSTRLTLSDLSLSTAEAPAQLVWSGACQVSDRKGGEQRWVITVYLEVPVVTPEDWFRCPGPHL